MKETNFTYAADKGTGPEADRVQVQVDSRGKTHRD